MTYTLYIADRMYSSWSLRGWLMLEKFSLPYDTRLVGLYNGTMAQDLAEVAPARLVPTLVLPDGTVVGETMAMAETLAERHPEAGLWPASEASRATARWLCAEMAAGFGALRSACPMQLGHIWQGFEPSEAVLSDLSRLETLFAHARAVSGHARGPLFGAYSLADVFYTPVAARVIGFDLPVSTETRAYCVELLSDPAVLAWQAEARKVHYDPEPYALDLERKPWAL
ncbi:glutathione S-transferase family protein [Tritonibacter mobilis]|jgi:glutathione S-transferase|uniref:glutathione S-transferase family protein n=1 Tax=Tritonibacter mobilis TaxID=379347 RepID=UPI003A5BCD84